MTLSDTVRCHSLSPQTFMEFEGITERIVRPDTLCWRRLGTGHTVKSIYQYSQHLTRSLSYHSHSPDGEEGPQCSCHKSLEAHPYRNTCFSLRIQDPSPLFHPIAWTSRSRLYSWRSPSFCLGTCHLCYFNTTSSEKTNHCLSHIPSPPHPLLKLAMSPFPPLFLTQRFIAVLVAFHGCCVSL